MTVADPYIHYRMASSLAKDNVLSHVQHQAITCTNDDFLSHDP